MPKKKLVRLYCEQCKKTTRHEIASSYGQESSICLACQKKAIDIENAEISHLNQNETSKNEADRIIMEEKVRELSRRYGLNTW